MIERKLSRLSSLLLLGAPLALAPLGGACGGSAASDHDGTSGASATTIGGASGSGVGSGATAGTIGAAASGGTSGSGASAGMMVQPRELCSVEATCHDGVIRGALGNYCTPFGATCEFGCHDTTFYHSYLGIEHDFDVALAGQLASDALCNDGEGGAGGDIAAGASGSAAQAGAGGD